MAKTAAATAALTVKDPYPIRAIRAGEAVIDRSQQRDLNRNKVEKIKTEYDWALAMTTIVGRVGAAKVLTVVSGQHTHTAQIEKFGPDVVVNVKDLGELTAEQAARYGLHYNTSPARPQGVSRWESMVKSHDANVLAVCDALATRGVNVENNLGANAISNPSPLNQMIKRLGGVDAGDAIGKAIDALKDAYPDGTDAAAKRLHHALLKATIEFVLQNPDITPVMIAKHALKGADPATFIAWATPEPGSQANWKKIGEQMARGYNSKSHGKIKAIWEVGNV